MKKMFRKPAKTLNYCPFSKRSQKAQPKVEYVGTDLLVFLVVVFAISVISFLFL